MSEPYDVQDAEFEPVPLVIIISGPPGSGKTKSSLLLADGLANVRPGSTVVIDGDMRRSLRYAREHSFKIIHLDKRTTLQMRSGTGNQPSYEPSEWLNAFSAAVDVPTEQDLPTTVIFEGFQREHIALNAWHDRLGGGFGGWKVPKAARRKLIDQIRCAPCHVIINIEAREKLRKEGTGKNATVTPMGWIPVAGHEWLTAVDALNLLPPAADGRPMWNPANKAQQSIVKVPNYLRPFPDVLDCSVGERWGRAAAGIAAELSTLAKDMIGQLDQCQSRADKEQADDFITRKWQDLGGAYEGDAVKKAAAAANARISAAQESQ